MGAGSSIPGMACGFDAVEHEVTDQVVFPAGRVVQGVGARVAPEAVEVVLAGHRAGTAQFEELAAGEQGGFGRQDFGLGDDQRGVGDGVFVRFGEGLVDRFTGLGENRFGAVYAPFQITDRGDGEWVLPAVILLAVDPWTGLACVDFCLFEGAHGNAGVDRRLDDLRNRAVGGRLIERQVRGNHRAQGHLHAVEGHAAAGGGALAEAVPTVDDREARRIALDEGNKGVALFVGAHGGHDMGEQRPGAVELLAIDLGVISVYANLGVEGAGVFALGFGERITETVAGQDLAEVVALLLLAAGLQQDIHHTQVVLRDLPQGRIGGGDRGRARWHRRRSVRPDAWQPRWLQRLNG